MANPNDRRYEWLEHAKVLPNIPFVPAGQNSLQPLPQSSNPSILFVGSFYHFPNIDGMTHFLNNIWGRIKQKAPRATLNIYGVGIEGSLRTDFLRHNGVCLIDPKTPLQDAYNACAFSIAPIYLGAGTCFKVVESLSLGRTLVLSPYAMRGYDQVIEHNETAWIAENDDSFVEGCIHLLNNPQIRSDFAEKGAQRVNDLFSYPKFQEIVDNTIKSMF